MLRASISGIKAALILTEKSDGHYAPSASWPARHHDFSYLTPAAELALQNRRGLIHRTGEGGGTDIAPVAAHAAFPIDLDGRLHGVVVIDLGLLAEAEAANVLRQLHWGLGWLHSLMRLRMGEDHRTDLDRTGFALAVLAAASDQPRLLGTAMALVNELASRLSCDRVSLGLTKGRRVRVVAISDAARFNRDSRPVALIEDAMEEALEQGGTVAFPPVAASRLPISLAHGALARAAGGKPVASVVVRRGGDVIGVLTLEGSAGGGFERRSLDLAQSAVGLMGPVLVSRQAADRLLAGTLPQAIGNGVRVVLGPRRPAAKLLAAVSLAAVCALLFWHAPFRVSGEAVVEAATLRAVVAPFDGFVASASAREGDRVEAGQVLATLDDRDLTLESLRARAAVEQESLKYHDAVGHQDRVETRIRQAALEEAQAQLEIVQDKLARSRLTVPVGGVIASGDLSQLVGSPVEKGKILFEVAPLDAYRLAIQVDESDVAEVRAGQTGTLVLAGVPDEALPFTVRTVIPVAEAGNRRNVFRVEAELAHLAVPLRPGMEGIGKIEIDRRSPVAIMARPILEWVRMTLWSWWP